MGQMPQVRPNIRLDSVIKGPDFEDGGGIEEGILWLVLEMPERILVSRPTV